MPAYFVANLRNVTLGPPIVAYLERIDATLAPYDGRFLVHGGGKTVVEGRWPDDLVVIAFPDREAALGWYASAAYQEILPLRLGNAESDVVLVEGVPDGHRAPEVLQG